MVNYAGVSAMPDPNRHAREDAAHLQDVIVLR